MFLHCPALSSNKSLPLALAAVLSLLSPFSLAAAPGGNPEETKKLVATLESQASTFEKAKACQRLAVVGTADAVPVLAGLLSDESIAHYARFALEPIPDASVDDALRAALGKLKGKLLVGVIGSVGARRDARAVDALVGFLRGGDMAVVPAAAGALGRIATPAAAAALTAALAAPASEVRSAAAQGSLTCSETLLAAGKSADAGALGAAVQAADIPPHLKAAGLRLVISSRGTAGLSILGDALKSNDTDTFELALAQARELPGEAVTGLLLASIASLPPERRAALLTALGDRGDRAAISAAKASLRDTDGKVRSAAVGALARLGDASTLPELLEAAHGSDEAAEQAKAALETFGSKEVDQALTAALETAQGEKLGSLIEVAGRRGLAGAVPALKKALGGTDSRTRLAALQALGETVGVGDLPLLIGKSISPEDPSTGAAAEAALKRALARIPDKDAAADQILQAMGAGGDGKGAKGLAILRDVGGKKALGAVLATARDRSGELKSAAFRTLGEWPTEDAAPALLGFLGEAKSDPDRASALQAFRQVVGGLRFAKEERLALCRKALEASRSDEERKVVVSTLAAIPAVETLPILTPLLAQAGLKEAAAQATVTIAERIIRYQAPEVREALKKVVEAGPSAELVAKAKALLEPPKAK